MCVGRRFPSRWGGGSPVSGEEVPQSLGRKFPSLWGGSSLVSGEEVP